MPQSQLEATFALQLRTSGLPEPQREYHFARSIGRRWRFDFCFVEQKLAVELNGGRWIRGRHNRGSSV